MTEKKAQGRPSTLFDLLAGRAGEQGDARAYTFLLDGETAEAHLTYAELDRQARAIGAALQALSAKGERVLLLYPPGLDYVAAFFGCLYAGAVAVPAYPPRSNRPSARLAAIQASSGAKVVLTVAAVLAGLDRQLQREEGVEWLATDGALLAGAEAGFREPGVRAD
ncbi:MAG TPA: AMP-binding protein, partial [Thermoanaerobaculia bacterium]|nr:AMP-binding protein [Thermoanaerobaculia bacterium]